MTLDLKRIFVPLDFSANSAHALDYAHALARRFSATLHLVHVCEVPSMVTGSMDAYAVAYTDWSRQLGEAAEKQLTRVAKGITDVPVTTEIVFGNPARGIVSAATGDHADLIVMGTHGHGAMVHMMLGNVAERVVRTAPCPVLTIRQHADKAATVIDHTAAKKTRDESARSAIGALLLALLLPAAAAAQSPDAARKQTVPGGELFRTYCAVCHGPAARGDGPLASSMTRKPVDLTEMAKRNGDVFPSELAFRTIDGRKPIRGHGGPDMPVWGDAFARTRDGGGDERVKKMIQSLVDFLESIQARPAQ